MIKKSDLTKEIKRIVKYGTKKKKTWLANEVMKTLYRTVDIDDMKKDLRHLKSDERDVIVDGAKEMKKMKVYQWLRQKQYNHIQQKIFDSDDKTQLDTNKTALWLMQVQDAMMDEITKENRQYKPLTR